MLFNQKKKVRLLSSEFFHWTRSDLDTYLKMDTYFKSNISSEKIQWTQAWPKQNLMSSIIGTSSDSDIKSSWLKIGVYLKTKEKNLMSCIIRTALDSFIKSSARLLVLLKSVERLKVIEWKNYSQKAKVPTEVCREAQK